MTKKNKNYTDKFRQEAVALVTGQGYIAFPKRLLLWVSLISCCTTEKAKFKGQQNSRARFKC